MPPGRQSPPGPPPEFGKRLLQGAKLDGILRSHTLGRAGELRDTCVYSLIASEWPAARAHLTWQLEKGRDG